MRLSLLCCAAMLATAGVPPAAAQPEAVDAAHLDRVLDALELDRQVDAALGRLTTDPMMQTAVDRISPERVRAAVRGHLAEGYSRERADRLLADRLGAAAFVDRMMHLQDPQAVAPALQALWAPPKKGVLADSAESARFVDASGVPAFLRQLMGGIIQRVADSSAAARADIARSGQTVDALVDDQVVSFRETAVLVDRQAPRAAGRQAARAFAESEAGRWAIEAVHAGIRDAFVPTLVAAVLASFEAQSGGR